MPTTLSEVSPAEIINEIDYLLLATEFDLLWGRWRCHSLVERARMDHIIGLIDAFEASRGKASFN